MNREKREPDYPVEIETQFIMRLPAEPAKVLHELIKSGENFKNRLTIKLDDDMRHGEVRLDHWLLHGKTVDLPTIVESWKSIDRKSLYKTADICQMMICKEELDPHIEDESPVKNKRKDPHKVDKKYLWPHGLTPPTKNIRKRRFRKTLRKKCSEAPEIEKEVKRLLRADNEAVSVTWEVIKDEDTCKNEPTTSFDKVKYKRDVKNTAISHPASKVEDIFGGALSDSDNEDNNVNVDIDDSRLSLYDEHLSDTSSIHGVEPSKVHRYDTEFKSEMFDSAKEMVLLQKSIPHVADSSSHYQKASNRQQVIDNSDAFIKLQQLVADLEELKQRRQRTQLEIAGMENMTLKQRFQDILKTLNKEILTKDMELQNLKLHLK